MNNISNYVPYNTKNVDKNIKISIKIIFKSQLRLIINIESWFLSMLVIILLK